MASKALRRQGELGASYSALPLSFELNQGQTNGAVKFLSRASGYLLFLTATEAVMALDNPAAQRKAKVNREELLRTNENEPRPPRPIVRMKLEGANPAPHVEGLDQLTSSSSYFGGPDPAQWRTNIPSYSRVRYEQVYPGIDMLYYGSRRQLEYDFIVAPRADPAVVEIGFKGIEGLEISTMGDLLLHTAQGDIRQRKPIAYQQANGTRKEVSASYIPKGASGIGF
ncbi:MAG TPA: hypothetical protein VLG74_11135, partial [Blastocatellia bacterium]|nr:hypothetical protein [Blastocatellia bacterium]